MTSTVRYEARQLPLIVVAAFAAGTCLAQSSRGLGRALAEAALIAGENVVATARNPDQLQELVKRYPGSARAVSP